ncbi:chromosome transmission fidelity factor 18 [Holotrichia oblita]|uniref:Chromosome transmission fidelity factor 18 n=1 Tax=Holotrichia oblita TaxID=644536 RepID=A0ACB9TFZ9_HOLOL|nr:chromosome transmission fidelity factor 18 [Holotrichia oblita]
MSKDIRSFFSVVSKKPNQNVVVSTKKRTIVLDSSDDEVVAASPAEVKKRVISKTKKRKIIDSDSDDENKRLKANKGNITDGKNNLKKVNAVDVFGSTPVKQAKVEKKEHYTEKDVKTNLDNDMLLDNINVLDKTIEEALNNANDSMSSNKTTKATPSRKRKSKDEEEEDTGIDKDLERYEKRRHSTLLYQKYLNRSGPAHHGSKEYPKGKPDCLNGLCFLRTGVLDSLEGEEFEELVKSHGGRTVHAVSKKVNYIVEGVEPGPAKLEKARQYAIPSISEDEFLDLILIKSGMPAKYSKGGRFSDDNTEDAPPPPVTKASSSKKKPEKVSPEPKKNTEKIAASPKKSAEKKHETAAKKPDLEKLSNSKQEGSSTDIPEITIKKESFYDKEIIKNDNQENKCISKNTVTSTIQKNLSWADKYKPTDIKGIIGQQGDKSSMRKLLHWLSKWYTNHSGSQKPKLVKPSPWNKSDDGGYFKCALLSGPPGIGKTTTATLVAKELGFDIVEFNASDTRSKRLLHEEVSQLLSTNSLAGFVKDGSAPTKKHVLLMDEVDGMAGNEDRGGMQELILLIKNTNVPIICMCNDRNHTKVRSLANYCFDLRFSRPRLEQIRGAMMSVCFKENLKIKPDALSQIISGTGLDVRQTLNHLSMWTVNNIALSVEEAEKEAKLAKKDTILGPWEVIRKVFSKDEHEHMTVGDKFRLFFYDYSIGPLFVQENYLQVHPDCPKPLILQRAAQTADCISKSDIVDKKMRSSNNWSLLEVQAIHSELQAHMRISTSGSRKSVNLDYIYHLRNAIIKPLANDGVGGIEKAMEVMHSYNLLREDLDSIMEVSHWSRQKDPMAMVDSKVKAAFTRAYNKDNAKLPYSVSSAAIRKKLILLQTITRGGLLVELMKRAAQNKQYAEIDHAIKSKIEPFLYNKGQGMYIPISQLVLLRNKDRPRHKWLPQLKVMENPEDFEIDDENINVSEEEYQRNPHLYRFVCWRIKERGAVGEALLHLCLLNATSIHADIAKRLLRFYPKLINDIYMSDEYYGENVLHIAIVNEDPSMVRFLLDAGVNIQERCFGNFMCPEDQKSSRSDSLDHEWVNVYPITNYDG